MIKTIDSKEALEEKLNLFRQLQQAKGTSEIEAINQLDEEINNLFEQEDTKWSQRAKQSWYQLRDKNTKYFHSYAT